ncbi:MAG: glycosyltransferase [Candidatus Eremiobacteraeota bacterium]|nr:glycosyltransferase [Candidatus Eremiobacteraeota bacterium]
MRGALSFFVGEPGVDVTLLAQGRDAGALRDEFAPQNITVAPQASAARRDTYDAVWFPFNGMRYMPAAPALVMMHDAFAFTQPHADPIARFREQAPMRRAARRAAAIAVQSQWTRGEIQRELHPGCDPVVIAPVADVFFFPAAGDAPPAPLDAVPYVLIVGVREPRKNAALAVQACARALRDPETLVVVGELSNDDRALAQRLGVRCGEVAASDNVLRALYRNARLVLVPSLAEGFGLVAAEALTCGAPVLASETSALPETTAGAAVLLDPLDVAAWAAAIRAVLDDSHHAATLRARTASFASADRTSFARATLALLRETAARGAGDGRTR